MPEVRRAADEMLPDWERQIGCMTGILQIFDRHHLIAGGRPAAGRGGHKRLPAAGSSPSGNSRNAAALQNSGEPQAKLEKNHSKSMTEVSSLSMESSRASCSSSSCSSFSSVDGNKSVVPLATEELLSGHRHCTDLRAIVKDSINRDGRGLSVKTAAAAVAKEEAMKGNALRHKDSPRPVLLSRSQDGTYLIGIDRTAPPPAKLPHASRFSCDGTEFTARAAAAASLRELPRLSLDSNMESPGGHRRSNSVIAKLMGLDALPDEGGCAVPQRRDLLLTVKTEVPAPPQAVSPLELRRRLKELDFFESNKDFRALRILEAVNTKKAFAAKRGDDESSSVASAASLDTPIVIMKPAKSFLSAAPPVSGLKTLRKLAQTEKTNACSCPSSGGSSPRTPNPRRADPEKKSKPPVSPPEPHKPRPASRQEPLSPRAATKLAPSKAASGKAAAKRPSPHREQHGALQSTESRASCGIQLADIEPVNSLISEIAPALPSENVPSPVSVLDASFGSPPLARIKESFKDGETHSSDECWNLISVPDTPPLKACGEGNQMKPEVLKALIQKLEQLSTEEEEPITIEKCDHQYIYEVFSASGLLAKDISRIKPLPDLSRTTRHLINPELFLVLEQTRSEDARQECKRVHRKLLFDMANELLPQLLKATGKKNGRQMFTELCREIDAIQEAAPAIRSDDIDAEEENAVWAAAALQQMKGWESFDGEAHGMVLDVERCIFRDLIDEIVRGEAADELRTAFIKSRKQLFKPLS